MANRLSSFIGFFNYVFHFNLNLAVLVNLTGIRKTIVAPVSQLDSLVRILPGQPPLTSKSVGNTKMS